MFLELPDCVVYDEVTIHVPDIDSGTLHRVLDFLYDGSIKVTDAQYRLVQEVMSTLGISLTVTIAILTLAICCFCFYQWLIRSNNATNVDFRNVGFLTNSPLHVGVASESKLGIWRVDSRFDKWS